MERTIELLRALLEEPRMSADELAVYLGWDRGLANAYARRCIARSWVARSSIGGLKVTASGRRLADSMP